MINLTCTSCKKLLQIDDAFAGGVCRCKFCGTIQTVPSQKAHRAAAPTATTVAPKAAAPAKTLFQSPSRVEPMRAAPPPASSGTGLDELAHIVASSGLAGTGLRAGHLRKPPPPAASNLKLYLIIGGSVLGTLVVVLVVWLIMKQSSNSSGGSDAQNGPDTEIRTTHNTQRTTNTPNYMGLPLSGPSVIYLLDHGSGTQETFDFIKRGAIRSIASLGAGTKFQLIFWETDSIIESPKGKERVATAENVAATNEEIKDVYAFSQSTIDKALQRALAQNPAEIVVVSGKYGLDDEFVNSVIALRKT